MSSTFSSCCARGPRTGTRRGRARAASSTAISSSATIATICCASTSSGLRGILVSSISPPRIAFATTADSSRSARNLGKMRPFEIEPSSCPARPIRCSPRATDFGLSTWITRSTAPMSIPSSRLRRGDEARDPPGLQVLLDHHPLLARERAVVGARDLFLGQLVQPQREPLGEAAVVDEDDRRAVLLDELEDRRVDRGPDRARRRLVARRPSRRRRSRPAGTARSSVPSSRMSSTGTTTSRSSSLRVPASTSWIGAAARDEAADLLERPLRRREADPLRRPLEQRVEPLERQRQVRAALGAGDGVHLVDDHRLDPAQRLARLRGEQQEERLGRRDQDVRRLLDAARAAPSAVVSPVRTPTRRSDLSPASGPRRFRSTS